MNEASVDAVEFGRGARRLLNLDSNVVQSTHQTYQLVVVRVRTAGHVLLSGAETLVERTDGIPKVGNRSEVPSPLSLDIGTDLAHARVQRSGSEHDPAEHRHQCDC